MPRNASGESRADERPRHITPFLKWAGGKRWLADRLVAMLSTGSGTYIEPFLGGGAIFFALRPKRAILSDANSELINTYVALTRDHDRVAQLLTPAASVLRASSERLRNPDSSLLRKREGQLLNLVRSGLEIMNRHSVGQ